MISNYFQKNQPKAHRQKQKKCMLCSKQFRVGRSEHQCKRCLRAICSDCGKEKIMLFKTGFSCNPHRGCKLCVQEIAALQQYIHSNQISFAKMSTIGQKWTKKIDRLSSYQPAQHKRRNEFRREIFSRMWDSYNYSMREFIGLLTFEKHQQQIYEAVSEVVKAVFGIFPNQDLQSVCYLSIFFLCFATSDKATLLCLHVIQLLTNVANSQGLLQAYLKALGLQQNKNVSQYLKIIGQKYIATLSVNFANINSSIYLIDKVITRRKIDEVYIFLCLSVDLIKESISKDKEQNSMSNVLLARQCSPNSISVKYRQLSNVKSANFMKQREEELVHSTSSMTSTHFLEAKTTSKASSSQNFTSGLKNLVESPINTKTSEQSLLRDNIQFQKKYGAEVNDSQNDNDDSLSTISMLEQMKELRRTSPERSEGKQILALLNVTEHSNEPPLLKAQSSFEATTQKPRSKGTAFTKQAQFSQPEPCRQCDVYRDQIDFLKSQLKRSERLSEMVDLFKEQNEKLTQKIRRLESERNIRQQRQTSTKESLSLEKSQLEVQVRRLKQSLTEYQLKEKAYLESQMELEQSKRTLKKQANEIKNLELQQEQSSTTIKLLKNRLENQSLETRNYLQRHSESTEASNSESKMLEMLKNNVKEKNAQIEQLTKRNKLLNYQLQDLNKAARKEGETTLLKNKLEKAEVERVGMMDKLNQLSLLLMNEEGEKLRLSEQNFTLRKLLKQHKISFEG